MPYVDEGGFRYRFPETWVAVKFDELTFYKNQIENFAGGTKAVDVVAVDNVSRTLWLIEAKDFRTYAREKKLPIPQELAEKVRGTLACLMAGRANAGATGDDNTDSLWANALRERRIRFIFHYEQPNRQSRLFPQSIDPKDLKDILDRAVRAADPHPVAGGQAAINQRVDFGWQVETAMN
jgi:hypothetical protein